MRLRTVNICVFGGAAAGVLATAVVWRPREGVVYTGFPFPIGVDVLLEDGTTDCGYSPFGYFLNAIAFVFVFSLVAAGIGLWSRVRRRAAASAKG